MRQSNGTPCGPPRLVSNTHFNANYAEEPTLPDSIPIVFQTRHSPSIDKCTDQECAGSGKTQIILPIGDAYLAGFARKIESGENRRSHG